MTPRQLALRCRALEDYKKIGTIEEFNASKFYGKHLPPGFLYLKALNTHEKCPSADYLDITYPCEGSGNFVSKLEFKSGIHLVIVSAKIMPNWLSEITKLIDFADRSVMQLRCFYAHAEIKYKNVDAEPVTSENRYLLKCDADGEVKAGQERFLGLASLMSYEDQIADLCSAESTVP